MFLLLMIGVFLITFMSVAIILEGEDLYYYANIVTYCNPLWWFWVNTGYFRFFFGFISDFFLLQYLNSLFIL